MEALKNTDHRLRIIDRKVRFLSRLNPLNARNEFRKLFSAHRQGKVYNPIFKYSPIQTNLAGLSYQLEGLAIKIPPAKNERWFFSQHLENKRRRIIAKINALNARATPAFNQHSQRLFGVPSPKHIAYARSTLENNKDIFIKTKDSLSSREAAFSLQKYLDSRALAWKVKVRVNISSKCGLDYRSKYLLVRDGENFAPQEVLSLAVHEIETHIYRRENGARQSFPGLFAEGFAGPPTTEEGLALFNELEHNYDQRRLSIICARTLAVHWATRKSFFSIFNSLLKYGLPIPCAWAVSLRAKRGFSDTSRTGTFGKDHHYLKGYLEIKQFTQNGGSLAALYIGKLNVNNVTLLEHLKIKVAKPKYLPIGYDS